MSIGNQMFEVLEARTMMTVTPLSPAAWTSLPHATPAVHAAAKVTKPAPAKTPAKAPAKTVVIPVQPDPALTDSAMKYQNFAADPLFSAAGPSPDDVKQGYIGDCYFLASLSAIAKVKPSVIQSDITAGGDGTYTVKFMTGKKAELVRVNADLPVWPSGHLAYAGLGAQNCTWVAVMEKAYAEFRTHSHSYASIDGGWMTDAFGALGLASKSVFGAATSKQLMNVVSTATKTRQFATFATGDAITDSAPLLADHAYEIDSVNYDAKGNAVSIRLRNPWGIDGAGNDGSDDGYVTITAAQALHDMSGIVTAHA